MHFCGNSLVTEFKDLIQRLYYFKDFIHFFTKFKDLTAYIQMQRLSRILKTVTNPRIWRQLDNISITTTNVNAKYYY